MKQLLLFVIIVILSGCFGTEPQKTGKEGQLLPAFSLLFPDSTTLLNTRNINTGKPMIFFYFSPYCPYCKAQTKEIVDNMNDLKDIQFYFVTNFRPTALRDFNKHYQLEKFQNVFTGIDNTQFLSNYFEIKGVPYLAFYDRNKKLIKTYMGNIKSSQLKEATSE
jgi:thioredoxin-related protein